MKNQVKIRQKLKRTKQNKVKTKSKNKQDMYNINNINEIITPYYDHWKDHNKV